jgi:hypothetical protein
MRPAGGLTAVQYTEKTVCLPSRRLTELIWKYERYMSASEVARAKTLSFEPVNRTSARNKDTSDTVGTHALLQRTNL